MLQTFNEDVRTSQRLRVDREAGVIHRVKLLGWVSANGREYDPKGVDPKLYEGRVVNIDHTKNGQVESAHSRFGRVSGVVKERDGLYGNIEYLKSHPMAGVVCEAAERMPGVFGMSHTAKGKTRQGPRGVVVEAVESVQSVDVVASPATTNGLNEHRNRAIAETVRRKAATMPPLFRREFDGDRRRHRLGKLLERIARVSPGRAALLRETAEAGLMDGGLGDATSGITTPLGSKAKSPEDEKRVALKKAVMELLGDDSIPFEDLVQQIASLLDADDTDEPEPEAKTEGRFAPFCGRKVSSVASVSAGLLEARVPRRAEAKIPTDPKQIGRWLRGGR